MRDLGNSVIVVEHDEDTMRASDYIVDIGPGAGEHGGELVGIGTAKELMKNKNSITGAVNEAPTKKIPMFDFEVPTELPGVDPKILDPRDTYADPAEWDAKAKDLAARFIKNFGKYTGNEAGKALVAAGPQL